MRRMLRQELVERFASVLRDETEFKGKGSDLLRLSERASSIAHRLAGLIDSGCAMVIHTDVIDNIGTPGRWGQHEPDPAGPPRRPKNYMGRD